MRLPRRVIRKFTKIPRASRAERVAEAVSSVARWTPPVTIKATAGSHARVIAGGKRGAASLRRGRAARALANRFRLFPEEKG